MEENWALLVKPTHDCNLNCQYCYDRPTREKFRGKTMPDEILQKIIKLSVDHAKNICWVWHGGEPTLMGADYYADKQKYFVRNYQTAFTQTMQSNGTLINDKKWQDLYFDYDMLLGVSFDGTAQTTRSGDKYYNIKNNIEAYNDKVRNCGIILVVNNTNFKELINSYLMIKNEMKINHLSFNYIFKSEGADSNSLEIDINDYSPEYRKFVKFYANDIDNPIVERTTLNYFKMNCNLASGICTQSDCRKQWLSFGPTGRISPCDRHLPENEFEIGNVQDFDSVNDIYASEGFMKYYNTVQRRLDNVCSKCGYYKYCKGGCNATHIEYDKTGNTADPNFCAEFKNSLNVVYSVLKEMNPFEKDYNAKVMEIFILQDKFFPMEIAHYLSQHGFTYKNHSSDEIIEMGENLFDTKEYKIFSLFNGGAEVKDGNYSVHTDVIISGDNSFSNLKNDFDKRQEKIDFIFKTHYNEFIDIYFKEGE